MCDFVRITLIFDAIINWMIFFISFSDNSFLVYGNKIFVHFDFLVFVYFVHSRFTELKAKFFWWSL